MTGVFLQSSRGRMAGIFHSVITCLCISACSDESKLTKQEILAALPKAKNEVVSLDLGKFSKNKIVKICVQPPYMFHESFAEKVGEKVKEFSEIDDRFFVLWLFYEKAPPTQVKFDRWREVNFNDVGTLKCIFSSRVIASNGQLYLEYLY